MSGSTIIAGATAINGITDSSHDRYVSWDVFCDYFVIFEKNCLTPMVFFVRNAQSVEIVCDVTARPQPALGVAPGDAHDRRLSMRRRGNTRIGVVEHQLGRSFAALVQRTGNRGVVVAERSGSE